METTFTKKLKDNVALLQGLFERDDMFRLRCFTGGGDRPMRFVAVFLDGMVSSELIYNSVIRPLSVGRETSGLTHIEQIMDNLYANEAMCVFTLAPALDAILRGDTLVFADGIAGAVSCNTKGGELRSVSEPDREKTLRGPRDGFVENIATNISLIRRRLQTHDFKCEFATVGVRSRTKVCFCYLDSVTKPEIVAEFKRRVAKIDIDGILESNYIEEQIADHRFSPFQTVGSTEKPDIAASRLLEGRVALIVDGTPVVLTVPYLCVESFQSADDYYLPFIYSTLGRMMRFFGFIVAVTLPGLYIAFVCYHHESIPATLLLKIAQASNNVPFPTVVECLIMLGAYELLRETGVRMSNKLGQALSTVGALVLGQAAVESGIVSTSIVIVVALSGITSLMVPRLKTAIIVSRLVCILLATLLGLYGLFVGMFITYIHLLTLDSFGNFYLEGFGALSGQRLKDIFWRAPQPYMKTRPSFARDKKRQS